VEDQELAVGVGSRSETDDGDSGILGEESADPVGHERDEIRASLESSSEPGPLLSISSTTGHAPDAVGR